MPVLFVWKDSSMDWPSHALLMRHAWTLKTETEYVVGEAAELNYVLDLNLIKKQLRVALMTVFEWLFFPMFDSR